MKEFKEKIDSYKLRKIQLKKLQKQYADISTKRKALMSLRAVCYDSAKVQAWSQGGLDSKMEQLERLNLQADNIKNKYNRLKVDYADIENCIELLPERYRQFAKLKIMQGKTWAAVATATGYSESQSRRISKEMYNMLAELIEKGGAEHGDSHNNS